MQLQVIHNKIYDIKEEKVMLDFDLAALYEVETKVFNQAVKRNLDLFPIDFMFQLSFDEYQSLRSQIVTLKKSGRGQHSKYLPFAFTEHGVAMVASVLKSEKARKMNIAIVRAFIALRKQAIQNKELIEILNQLRNKVDAHDEQFNQIYETLENMLDEQVDKREKELEWKNRERIGFKK
jgi:phage regulator Rha-like protein